MILSYSHTPNLEMLSHLKKMIVPSFAGLNVTTIFNVLEHQRNLHLDTKIQQIKQFSSCLIFPHLTNSIQNLLL